MLWIKVVLYSFNRRLITSKTHFIASTHFQNAITQRWECLAINSRAEINWQNMQTKWNHGLSFNFPLTVAAQGNITILLNINCWAIIEFRIDSSQVFSILIKKVSILIGNSMLFSIIHHISKCPTLIDVKHIWKLSVKRILFQRGQWKTKLSSVNTEKVNSVIEITSW